MSTAPNATADQSARPHFLVRDGEGIRRLAAHLRTHWKLPRIGIEMDAFPAEHAHRARARIGRYSGMSGVHAGGLVAGLVVMISTGLLIPATYRDWNLLLGWHFAQHWSRAAWMFVPGLLAGSMVYLGVETWIRVRLLQELQRLHRRSRGWIADPARTSPRHAGADPLPQAGEQAGGTLTILSRLSERHIVQLHALYQREWWSAGRSLDATRRGVKGSQLVIGLVDGSNELVGFARVLTDYTFKALIFDVIVAENSRHQRLGRKLVDLVTGHEALQQVRHFELYCLPELVEFYVPHGFSPDVGNIRLMRKESPTT